MVERIFKKSTTRVRIFLYLFILLTLVWMALTSTLHWQELTAGVLISFILSLFLSKSYVGLGLPTPTVKTLSFLLIYIASLFKEIIKANIDVAYRVVHPKMPIRPGIVVVKTELKQDLAKLMLANSITLTPGTFTLDIAGDKLLIHWINVSTQDEEKATQAIALKFEKHLKRVFS